MSVLFVYDHRFMLKDGEVYSNTFSYSVLKQYVDIFSKVTIVARSIAVDDVDRAHISTGDGLEFIFVENISTFQSFFGLRQRINNQLKALVKDHDVVIARLPSELGLMVSNLAFKMHKKCLVEVVGCTWGVMWNYGGLISKLYAPIFYLRVKSTIYRSQYVTYVTNNFLQLRYPSSKSAKTIGVSDVILSPINRNILNQRVTKIETLGEKIVFGTIGDWSVKYKGIEIVIEALSILQHQNVDFEYHLLGAGDPKKYISLAQSLDIRDKVIFDGVLPRGKAVDKWLDKIDIYLQPSLTEGLPRSLIESMSRGCPAIGSSVGGIPELLDKNMLFSPREKEQLFEKIEYLLHDKEKMIDIAEKNFNKTKEYQQELLDEKRKIFWLMFREDKNF